MATGIKRALWANINSIELSSSHAWAALASNNFILFFFQIPTINQETGIAGPEPNATLKAIRSDKVLRPTQKQQGKVRQKMPSKKKKLCSTCVNSCNFQAINAGNSDHFQIYFGQNMVWKDRVADGKGKMMKVGDPVYVIKKVSSAAEAVAWTF